MGPAPERRTEAVQIFLNWYASKPILKSEVLRSIATALIEARTDWLLFRGNKWLVDPVKLRVAFDLSGFDWLSGPAFVVEPDFTAGDPDGHEACLAVLVFEPSVLQALLETNEDRRARLFDDRGFHRLVVEECRDRFLAGDFQSAISLGCVRVQEAIRQRISSREDGEDLMTTAFFKTTPPLLKFNALASKTDESEQRGVAFMFRGMVAALRNPNAHEIKTHDEPYTLECLSFLSLLCRYLDQAIA